MSGRIVGVVGGVLATMLLFWFVADVANITPVHTASFAQTALPNQNYLPLVAAGAQETSLATTTPTVTPGNPIAPTATATVSNSATTTPTQQTEPALLSIWLLNTTNERAAFIKQNGTPVPVNVQSALTTTINNASYARILSSGIPNYRHTLTQAEINGLNQRPQAARDFVTGSTSANAGQVVEFGQNIGYRSNNQCTTDAGYGYWPPGPTCPNNLNRTVNLPLSQTPATNACATGLGPIGVWVNGVSIYNWSDGQSYQNQRVWQNVTGLAESYAVDLCGGHAARDDYHHHGNPSCLGEQLNDTGSTHSPIYGVAADGYPVYGPWHDNGTLAQSCWKPRDYSATSPTGCGVDNKRTCLLVDATDISRGTTAAPSAGPDVGSKVTVLLYDNLVTESGFYYQDYYFDAVCAAQGGAHLDQHNGHSHDGLGYHYHTTLRKNADGSLRDAFPFIIGPTFYGQLQSNALARCGGIGPPDGPPVPVQALSLTTLLITLVAGGRIYRRRHQAKLLGRNSS